jgi:hypothetical protein
VRRLARLAVVGGGMLVAGFVGTQLAHADSGPTVTDQLNKAVTPVTQAPMHVVEQADRVISVAPAAIQGLTTAVVPRLDSTVSGSVSAATTVVKGTIANLHGELAPVTKLVGTLLGSSPTTTTVTAPAPHTTTHTTSGRGTAAHVRTTVKAGSARFTGVGPIRRVDHTRPAGSHLTPADSKPVPSGPAQDPAPASTGVTLSPTLRHVEALRTLGLGPETAWQAPIRLATTTPSRDTTTEIRLAYGSSRPD